TTWLRESADICLARLGFTTPGRRKPLIRSNLASGMPANVGAACTGQRSDSVSYTTRSSETIRDLTRNEITRGDSGRRQKAKFACSQRRKAFTRVISTPTDILRP